MSYESDQKFIEPDELEVVLKKNILIYGTYEAVQKVKNILGKNLPEVYRIVSSDEKREVFAVDRIISVLTLLKFVRGINVRVMDAVFTELCPDPECGELKAVALPSAKMKGGKRFRLLLFADIAEYVETGRSVVKGTVDEQALLNRAYDQHSLFDKIMRATRNLEDSIPPSINEVWRGGDVTESEVKEEEDDQENDLTD